MSVTSFRITPNTEPTSAGDRAAILADPGFGRFFTDHMVHVRWSASGGWETGEVRPYGPLSLDPATAALHYGQTVFEGIKAYRHPDGSVWTFRPERNAERLRASARRLALPEPDTGTFLEALEALVRQDVDWVPTPQHHGAESSLYLRPFMIASEPFLGVRPSRTVDFHVIACPTAAYFAGGVKPVRIWLSSHYTRAAPGGTGAAKCGGNYAASLAAQQEASAHDCEQVVFLDASEHRWVEELGGMNVCFVFDNERLVTPPVSGTILEGVTRASLLELAADAGLSVEERPVSIGEWIEAADSGALTEVFACGTAAVVTPIGELVTEERTIACGDSDGGTVGPMLRRALLDLQYGHRRDERGWMTRLA
ncbi:branched-chain amino acid aminotransferase [Arhodomonas aquaeolei]|uniref:branched-chain amino acid aminotransferase n=1 Tax=Arhodomonas aquaeolei TaxID=2369 RepID=UPI000372E1C5|nr:branched-chain amino acid aminotransferase [Arhodomonas aquaeolei]